MDVDMARPRVINPDSILDAAEKVVIRDGASHLTLDSVAAEAGISKASVLYDYQTKHALIKAVVERKVVSEDRKVHAAIENLGGCVNAQIRGRIAAGNQMFSEETQAVALNLCSALAQDQDLRVLFQKHYDCAFAAISETSVNPRRALLAFLALEGMKTLQLLGMHHWSDSEARELLAEIEALAMSSE